jgi:hypothetical protein
VSESVRSLRASGLRLVLSEIAGILQDFWHVPLRLLGNRIVVVVAAIRRRVYFPRTRRRWSGWRALPIKVSMLFDCKYTRALAMSAGLSQVVTLVAEL